MAERASGFVTHGNTVCEVLIRPPDSFSLALTSAPVTWGAGRWPNASWEDGVLTVVGWFKDQIGWRTVSQEPGGNLLITGNDDALTLRKWAADALFRPLAIDTDDSVIVDLHRKFVGMHVHHANSLWEGLLSSVIGQGVSLAAAGIAATKLGALVGDEVTVNGKTFLPLPRPQDLAGLAASDLRYSGLTGARNATIVGLAESVLDGTLAIDGQETVWTPERLTALRGIGTWTAVSARIWGLGDDRYHPTGDAALLRAARLAYGHPTMTYQELDELASKWGARPASAARLLWTNMFGAPAERG